MSRKRWHWQIDELGQGPDYVFKMEFAPPAETLHALVARQLPRSYVTNDLAPRPPRFGHAASYSAYVDRNTYAQLRAMQISGVQKSLWFHGRIEVVDHRIIIRHVLAGGMYDETELILSLARSPELTLTSWQIAYAGYEWGDVAAGASAAELLEYLGEVDPR
jgi:hypothetical protein